MIVGTNRSICTYFVKLSSTLYIQINSANIAHASSNNAALTLSGVNRRLFLKRSSKRQLNKTNDVFVYVLETLIK